MQNNATFVVPLVVPIHIKNHLKMIPVKHMEQVLSLALGAKGLPAGRQVPLPRSS